MGASLPRMASRNASCSPSSGSLLGMAYLVMSALGDAAEHLGGCPFGPGGPVGVEGEVAVDGVGGEAAVGAGGDRDAFF